MSDADIARERAEKAALEVSILEAEDEVAACSLFFQRTGGIERWKNKWGWFEKKPNLRDYSGVRLDGNGKVADIMLPMNGLTNSKSANPEGNEWGEGLHGLRNLQSLNIHRNELEGSLEEVMQQATLMSRADHFLKRPQHFECLRNIDICRNK
jgi:hypothetical protein